ncbi:MAG: magnesium transporter [Nanoarchaeota archaeon]
MTKKSVSKTDSRIIRDLYRSEDKISLFKQLPSNKQGFILLQLSDYMAKNILSGLDDDTIIGFLHFLDPDEATDLLQYVNATLRKRILRRLNEQMRNKVEYLLRFSPNTAAGLMSLDYIEIGVDATFRQVGRAVRKHERVTGKFPVIFVVDDGFIKGELPEHKLILHEPDEYIKCYLQKTLTIPYDYEQREIVSEFKSNPHSRMAVLDDDKSIMGVIYSDDILNIIRRHDAGSLSSFGGIKSEEGVYDPVMSKVKHRYQWLILNLLTAFLASSIVGIFQDTISELVLLAVYMPVIAGMGGNTATQTLAVTIRGITSQKLDLKTGHKVILKESVSGIINGVIIGILVGIVAIIFNQSPLLGVVAGISMVFSMMAAGFFGAVIPLIMKRLGKDPATSAAIFITTATDLMGFFVFLGLSTLVLL